jgi:hypothetical protein
MHEKLKPRNDVDRGSAEFGEELVAVGLENSGECSGGV